jgi:hydroxypyruvate isomerase
MKASVCIDIMMTDSSLSDRIHAVREVGMTGFEFWKWENKNIEELEETVRRTGLEVVAFCTKFVSLVDPLQRDQYVQGLEESISLALRLGCKRLITQTGLEMPGVAREEQRRSLVDGLKACVPLLEDSGIILLVEPLNIIRDHKGYFLSSSEEAFEIIAEVDSINVRVLYDVYHQQITEGNLIPTIKNNIELIGHFHIADHPGRNEPGTGEINYSNVLKAIKETGYSGWIGLEYVPTKNASLALQETKELIDSLG